MNIVSIKIKQYRKLYGYTQEEFANQLNISVASVKMYENSTRTPSKKIKIDICRLCNITLNELDGINDRIELKNEISSKLDNIDYTEIEFADLKRKSIEFLYHVNTESGLAQSLKCYNTKNKNDYYIIVIRAILYYIQHKYMPVDENEALKIMIQREDSIYDKYCINFIKDNINFLETVINEIQPKTSIEKYLIPLVSELSEDWNFNVSNTNKFIELPYSLKKKNKSFIAFCINDESMIPKYEKENIVIIEWKDEFEDKDDIVISINGNIKIRRIYKNKTGIILKPLNPNYDIEFYSNYEVKAFNIIVLGKIIGLNLTN